MDSIKHHHQMPQQQASTRTHQAETSDPAAEVGFFLRRERERYGCSIEEAGLATRINRRYLAAIEDGDIASLPDPDDALRYVCTYAEFLGFEPAPLAQHYSEVITRMRRHPEYRARAQRTAEVVAFPFARARSSTVNLLLGVLVATGLFAGAAWYIMPGQGPGDQVASASADGPGTRMNADPITTGSIGQNGGITITEQRLDDDSLTLSDRTSQEPEASGEVNGLDGLTEFIKQNVEGATLENKPAEGQAQISSPKGRVFGNESEASRLTLRANATVWVRIEDRDGNVILTQTLMPGDAYRVPERDDLVVIARDGGALTYMVDGEERGTLGAPGEILVGRSLDVRALANVSG